jgi:hypothetical protein
MLNERDNLGDAGTDGSVISKWILEWLGIESRDGFFQHGDNPFNFLIYRKVEEISWLAE